MGNNPTETPECSVIIAQPVLLFRFLNTHSPLEGESVEIVANTFSHLKVTVRIHIMTNCYLSIQ